MTELRKVTQIGSVQIHSDGEDHHWLRLLLPGSRQDAGNGLRISIAEMTLAPPEGRRFGNTIIRDRGIRTLGPQGKGVDIAYDSGTLDSASSIIVKFEPGLSGPWLVEHIVEPLAFIMNLTRGIVFVHAAALTFSGNCLVAFGWTRIGKTQFLLQALSSGAKMVSDDWVGISTDGLVGYPRAVKLSRANISSRPEFASRSTILGGEWFLNPHPSEISEEKLVHPDEILTIFRYEGTGCKPAEVPIETAIGRMPFTLGYMLVHYMGLLVSASHYQAAVPRDELAAMIQATAEPILAAAFDHSRACEIYCGYESEEDLLSFAMSTLKGGSL